MKHFTKMLERRLCFLLVVTFLLTLILADVVLNDPACLICTCENDTFAVNCSRTNITYIPEDPTGNTMILNMSFTKLGVINNTFLWTYSKLEVLDLSSTSLMNINPSDFSTLTHLKYLNLSNNERLPMTKNTTNQDLFSKLVALIELKIYGNTGTYTRDGYPDTALSKMKKLNSLWIDGLTNVSFGEEFRNMESLKSITIPGDIIQPPWRFCETNIVDHMLDSLIHVTSFTMRKCGVKCVSSNAFQNMNSLVYLDLSFNRFLTIECMAKALPSLSNTKLEVLVLNSIENVRQISCGPTITRQIAKSLSNIKTLKELHLEYNAINGFERGAIKSFPKSLQYINVKRNEFELGFYAFDVYHLENLMKLDISYSFFPDESEIWHSHKAHFATGLTGNTCLSCQTSSITGSNKPDFIHPICLEKAVNQSSTKACSSLDKKEDGTDPDDSSSNTDRMSEKNLVEILSNYPTERTTDITNHLIDAMGIPLKLDRAEMKHYSGEQSNVREKVCPQDKTYIPPGTIIAFLPPKLEIVDLSHSKAAYPIPELYFNETNSIKSINASNSLLFCWDGPIHGLTKLEYVDLSGNICTNISSSFFDEAPSLKTLLLSKNLLFASIEKDINGRILSKLKHLEKLDLSFNRLQIVPPNFLINQINLKELDLSRNKLDKFEVEISHMRQLDTLNLRDNSIQFLSEEVRNNLTRISERNYKTTKKTLNVYLNDNAVLCFCNNIKFLQWVYDHMSTCRFLDVTISRCVHYNLTVIDLNDHNHFGHVLKQLKADCASYTGLIIGVSIAFCVLLNICIGVLLYRFRWKLRYWYYVAPSKVTTRSGYISINSLSALGSRFKYDVYVTSIPDDMTFVMERLKKRLENEHFRLFIQDYDIVPGQNIYSMIANAIHVSRVVIFVISEACENDKEWKIAIRMAHEESIKRGRPLFFGIFIDHEPGTPYSSDVREIRRRSFVDYPGDSLPANEQSFWSEIIRKISEIGDSEIFTFELGIQ